MQQTRQFQIKINFQPGLGHRETKNGTAFIGFPVTLLVEGVHHGVLGGPVFYSSSALRASASDWNGMPLTIGHPRNHAGDYVLCDTNQIQEKWSIGFVDNVAFKNSKLKGIAWIDILAAHQKTPNLVPSLNSGTKMEISTGMMTVDDGQPGSWNEEQFSASILRIHPDHLALLPNEIGACSWNDGCGIRANTNGENTTMKEQPYVAIKLFDHQQRVSSNDALQTAISHLQEKHGSGANAQIRAMSGTSLLLLGEQVLWDQAVSTNTNQGDNEAYVPPELFKGRG